MYELEWLPDGILRMRLSGFWDNRLMSSFTSEVAMLVDRKPVPVFDGLCDISELLVQSPDIVLRFQALLDDVRAAGMRRGAVVVTSALLKLQAGRAIDPSRSIFVATMAEGRSWIDAMRAPERVAAD